jgi:hypothetical protein
VSSCTLCSTTGCDERVAKNVLTTSSQVPLLLFQSLLIPNKRPRGFLPRCFESVVKHLGASFSQCKPLSQLHNRHCSLFRLRIRFLSLLKGALFLSFKGMVQRELQVMGFQHLEDRFSVVRTNSRPCRNLLGLGDK